LQSAAAAETLLANRGVSAEAAMQWSRDGTDGMVPAHLALQNQELDALSRQHFGLAGSGRISWAWPQAHTSLDKTSLDFHAAKFA
jgi:hypothetical protein